MALPSFLRSRSNLLARPWPHEVILVCRTLPFRLTLCSSLPTSRGTRRATTLWATAARKKLLSFTTIPRATGRGRSMPPTRETPPVYRPLQRGRTGITRTRSLFRAIRDTASLKSSPPPSTLWPKRSRCAASGAPTRPATTTASTATRPLCRLPRVATKTDQTRSQTHTQS